MPTPTYDLIEEQVLSSAALSVTFGSGGTLTQAYKDLIIEARVTNSVGNTFFQLRFNGDTATNYSVTTILGNGSSAISNRGTNDTAINWYSDPSTNGLALIYANIMSYTRANVNKTVLIRGNDYTTYVGARVGLWRKTPEAITSITVLQSNGNFGTGSVFRLWGVSG